MKKDVMYCPHCGRAIEVAEGARAMGKKGGAAGRGEAKRRTSEQARSAAMVRWAKRKPTAAEEGYVRICNERPLVKELFTKESYIRKLR